ncbi:MAG: M48 family metallopeptidase [Xanthobacteraceae bacterium]
MTMILGTGVFFDGATSERQEVAVELAPATLRIRSQSGDLLAEWSYAEIEQIVSPDAVLRVGPHGVDSLARLEIRDPAFAAALDELATTVDRTGAMQRRGRSKLAVLIVAATASFAFLALVALPALATRLTPFIPFALERKIGQAADAELRAAIGSDVPGLPLDCGGGQAEREGQAALQSLVNRLAAAAGVTMPVKVGVLRRSEANAIALPGGQIYVFHGLIAAADTPDELAGAIAHEIGHVIQRDGMKAIMEAAGLSFLFGILLGDFVGGGAVVVAARSVLESSYSRETEAAADSYAVAVMNMAGRDADALGRILARVGDMHGSAPEILLEHPATEDRIAAIHALAAPPTTSPLLTSGEWAALKQICAGM